MFMAQMTFKDGVPSFKVICVEVIPTKYFHTNVLDPGSSVPVSNTQHRRSRRLFKIIRRFGKDYKPNSNELIISFQLMNYCSALIGMK
jgi:hypothetical protein